MAITSSHVTGFFLGLGVAAGGFVLYKQNQEKVDGFLRSKGINVPGASGKVDDEWSLDELVAEKERLEDLIAEKEYAAKQTVEKAAPAKA